MAEHETRREGFTFYESYLDSIEKLPVEEQLPAFLALTRFGLRREKPQEELPFGAGLIYGMAEPVIEKSWNSYCNGKEGGKKSGETRKAKSAAKAASNTNEGCSEGHENDAGKGASTAIEHGFDNGLDETPKHDDNAPSGEIEGGFNSESKGASNQNRTYKDEYKDGYRDEYRDGDGESSARAHAHEGDTPATASLPPHPPTPTVIPEPDASRPSGDTQAGADALTPCTGELIAIDAPPIQAASAAVAAATAAEQRAAPEAAEADKAKPARKAKREPAKKFVPPTFDEVKARCVEKEFTHVSPAKFYNHYHENGWKSGRRKMKTAEDWQTRLESWEREDAERAEMNGGYSNGGNRNDGVSTGTGAYNEQRVCGSGAEHGGTGGRIRIPRAVTGEARKRLEAIRDGVAPADG